MNKIDPSLGGKVNIESEDGKVSEFVVSLLGKCPPN
jgi:hypothetical protein